MLTTPSRSFALPITAYLKKALSEHWDYVILVHQGLETKKLRTQDLSDWKQKYVISWDSIFRGKFSTVSHHMHLTWSLKPRCRWCSHTAPLVTPYTVVVFLARNSQPLFLEWLSKRVVVWSRGLQGSAVRTFKARSGALPLSQERSLSHGLCLLQEKQWATWKWFSSHGPYQEFLSEWISDISTVQLQGLSGKRGASWAQQIQSWFWAHRHLKVKV